MSEQMTLFSEAGDIGTAFARLRRPDGPVRVVVRLACSADERDAIFRAVALVSPQQRLAMEERGETCSSPIALSEGLARICREWESARG